MSTNPHRQARTEEAVPLVLLSGELPEGLRGEFRAGAVRRGPVRRERGWGQGGRGGSGVFTEEMLRAYADYLCGRDRRGR